MAKQLDGFHITGTIGGITYYKVGDNYYARKKTSLSRRQVMKDPSFANTRKSMAEFGRAANASKLLRDCFRNLIDGHSDANVSIRLNKQMLSVMRTDEEHERGERQVGSGDIRLLEDFDFMEDSPLVAQFKAPVDAGYNRRTGIAGLMIPAFDPRRHLRAPMWAMHFKISFAAASVDFNENRYEVQFEESATFPMRKRVADIKLCCNLKDHPGRAYILVAALQFLQIVNGNEKEMPGGSVGIVSASN
jgi:hypothetical protein